MIIATAGHVDHGKSALVKQLTGVETDRLEEEKRRGLSINLGYAYLARENGLPLGFIDVPGHLKFINTMIAGISGIDLALLVVAADDGVMPQTIEHLDVLSLMGLQQLVLVITKVDRVDAARTAKIESSIRALCAARSFETPSAFSVDNISGAGIDSLRDHLLQCEPLARPDPALSRFQLSVDRAFNIKGAGLVVTGTCVAGSVKVGDSLALQPRERSIRVRSLRVHDREADSATAGQRVALNVSGSASVDDVTRGDWLTQPDVTIVTDRIDVDLRLLESAPFALQHGAPVKLYCGAKRIAARVFFLDAQVRRSRLSAGGRALAQLELADPIVCFSPQRFVLRDDAEGMILGGGTILDPYPTANRKRSDHAFSQLEALTASTPQETITRLLALNTVLCLEDFASARNMCSTHSLRGTETGRTFFEVEGKSYLLSESNWQLAKAALIDTVAAFHRDKPRERGIKASTLSSLLQQAWPAPLVRALLLDQLRIGSLRLSEGLICAAKHQPEVSTADQAAWEQLQAYLQRCEATIPLLSEVAASTGLAPGILEKTAKGAVKRGALFALSQRRYALATQLLQFANDLLEMTTTGEEITVKAAKQRWGVGRNQAVEILEYFDGIRFTARNGQTRKVLDAELPARMFSG